MGSRLRQHLPSSFSPIFSSRHLRAWKHVKARCPRDTVPDRARSRHLSITHCHPHPPNSEISVFFNVGLLPLGNVVVKKIVGTKKKEKMSQARRHEAGACSQEERDAIKDDPAILNQATGKCNHDKLCDIVTERMQIHDELKHNLASLSVAAAKDTKCKRS